MTREQRFAQFQRAKLPLILGHRGARLAAPENSLAALDRAMDENADGVEIDVRLNRSGDVIVLHDRTLDRVTQGRDRRAVEHVDRADLTRVDLGGGERVPLLSEVFRWAERRGAVLNVELKHDVRSPVLLVSRVVELVCAERDRDRLLLSCFHPGIVFLLRRRLRDVAVAWLVHEKQVVFRYAPGWRLLGAAGVHPQRRLITPSLVKRLHEGGAFVNTWTVNDVEEATRFAELGVDGIISDVPGAIVDALRGGV